MGFVITVISIFLVLVASEIWWRKRNPHDEVSRKFVHIVVGSFAAFWPFYLSWNEIIILSIAFIAGVVVSKYLRIFQAIHAVQRPTWGEICFAMAIGAIALVTREPWLYAAAVLHMSLADGLAAIVGVSLGKSNSYKVFGHTKSLIGSATFFGLSLGILFTVSTFFLPFSAWVIIPLALAATLLENISVRGLDNFVVPVLVAVVLSAFV